MFIAPELIKYEIKYTVTPISFDNLITKTKGNACDVRMPFAIKTQTGFMNKNTILSHFVNNNWQRPVTSLCTKETILNRQQLSSISHIMVLQHIILK